MSDAARTSSARPLEGVRVIDAGRFVAGPVTATLLAEFGADVIKVERPGSGDELRRLGWLKDSKSLWWSVEARNKRSITLDLGHPAGQALFRRLVAQADVVIENFRAGTMEKWSLGWDDLHVLNPKLIMLRTSGYGQSGPYRERPAFNTTAEAFGGLRYLIGEPDRAPARAGIALGDYAGAIFGAIGVLVSLYERDANGSGAGQMIDNALYEAVMRLTEYTIPAYGHLGRIRERVGAGAAGTVPARAFLTRDDRWVALSAASDRVFGKLCAALEMPALAEDDRFVTNARRVENVEAINAVIEEWMSGLSAEEALEKLEGNGVPGVLVHSAADIVDDAHVAERGALVTVADPELGLTTMPGVVPRLSRTPGQVTHAGPTLGQHNDEVYGALLGMSAPELEELREEGVI